MVDIDSAERHIVTLKDVAVASGVSISTVSRVLDDRTPRSKSATAERVRAVADELGYRRNVSASSLRRGITATIGVLVPRLTDAVMAMMFEAIERAAHRRGYFAVVATCGDDAEEERRATETLLGRGVDGVVLATARLDDVLPASLRSRGIPHVLALRTDGVSPSSLGDDETGGYLAVRHLVDLGHRDIGVITGPEFTSSGRDRRAGAERALREAGVDPRDGRVLAVGYGLDHGIVAARRLLGGPDRPTAVFAANDNLALGVSTVAQAMGMDAGRDLSLVGYNDIPLVSRLPVPLTSVHTHFDRIAEIALDLLLDADGAARIERTMPTLIPRASTAPPRH
jgi:LacI family transcriptional regulator